MAKRSKKKNKQPWEETFQDTWSYELTNENEIIDYLQKLANHMVLTGLEKGQGGDEDARLARLDAIMESEEWEVSSNEMNLYLPKAIILETLRKFSTLNELGLRAMTEDNFLIMLNKLSELCVYGLMQELAKAGHIKLAWDPDRNDFIYMANEDGEDWKKT